MFAYLLLFTTNLLLVVLMMKVFFRKRGKHRQVFFSFTDIITLIKGMTTIAFHRRALIRRSNSEKLMSKTVLMKKKIVCFFG